MEMIAQGMEENRIESKKKIEELMSTIKFYSCFGIHKDHIS
jgi:hypothetical protein